MQNNFPKISLFVSVLFLCILSIVFFYFYSKTNSNNQKAQASDLEWQKETLRRNEIKELDNSIRIVEAQRVELENHFAQSSDAVPFLDTLEKLAPQVGAEASVTSVDITTDHLALLVGLQASGTFANVYRFITLLENSPYELQFMSMNLQQGPSPDPTDKSINATNPNWNAIFKIKLLSFTQ